MSHAHTNLIVHTIFSTKNRLPLIPPEHAKRLYAYMAGVARGEFGEAIRIGGMPDHIHALLRIGADLSVGQVMSKFKGLSSGWAHKTIPELRDMFWQVGYGAFSVSKSNLSSVAAYVDGQEQHHVVRTFQDEYIEFLKRHEISFDPNSVWG